MVQVRLFISGFVQGVGYRAFVKRHAQKLSLTGWVKNLPDGRVEALLNGKRIDIESLIEKCRKGPFLSEVENVNVSFEESQGDFSSFQILRE